MTTDNSGLLKIECYMKERVFIVEQYFKNNGGFLNKIIFSNKAYFHLNGLVDKQIHL